MFPLDFHRLISIAVALASSGLAWHGRGAGLQGGCRCCPAPVCPNRSSDLFVDEEETTKELFRSGDIEICHKQWQPKGNAAAM